MMASFQDGRMGTPRGAWPATTLPILTQIRVFVKTSSDAFNEPRACPRAPRGGPQTETDSRPPEPWPERRGGRQAAIGTARRAPAGAAARAPERSPDGAAVAQSRLPPPAGAERRGPPRSSVR